MYPSREPLPKPQVVALIEERIAKAASKDDASLMNAWIWEEMGVDSEEAMFGMIKDFIETHYWWLFSFSMH